MNDRDRIAAPARDAAEVTRLTRSATPMLFALAYARRGFHVFPCHSAINGACSCGDPSCDDIGKHPRILNSFKDATTDEATIRGWWARWPTANTGIATGASKIVVIDQDPTGKPALDAWIAEDPKARRWPMTPTATTGRPGGHHYYFAAPEGVELGPRTGIFGPESGVDVRAGGSYVIAPGSIHKNGTRYRWTRLARPSNTPLNQLPAAMIAHLQAGPVTANGERQRVTDIPPIIHEGEGRDTSLFRYLSVMRRNGSTENEMLAAAQVFNADRCRPPLSDRVVEQKVRSAMKYEPDPSVQFVETNAARSAIEIGTFASQIKIKPIEWLWHYRIPEGMLGLLDGNPGDGKSTVVADFSFHLTTGTPWPDGSPCPRRGVVICGVEDSWELTVKPRLVAAGADTTRTLLVDTIPDGKGGKRIPSLPGDLESFERAIKRADAGLIVFDPIMSYLDQELNANSPKDVTRALDPLAHMLDRLRCSGLMLRHFSKDNKVSHALYRGLASIAFMSVSRFAMAVAEAKAEDEEDGFVLMSTKNTNAPKRKARRYYIEQVKLPSPAGVVETSRITWGTESEDQADERLTAFGSAKKKKDLCQELMLELLADGPMDAPALLAALKARAISEKTIYRTKDALGVISRKKSMSDGWEWWLPKVAEDPAREGGQVLGPRSVDGQLSLIHLNDHLASSSGHLPVEVTILEDAEDGRVERVRKATTFEPAA